MLILRPCKLSQLSQQDQKYCFADFGKTVEMPTKPKKNAANLGFADIGKTDTGHRKSGIAFTIPLFVFLFLCC